MMRCLNPKPQTLNLVHDAVLVLGAQQRLGLGRLAHLWRLVSLLPSCLVMPPARLPRPTRHGLQGTTRSCLPSGRMVPHALSLLAAAGMPALAPV
jgi:hypothetical protein